jgi:hypothetical protein
MSLGPTNSGSVTLTSFYNAEQIELRLSLTIKPKHPDAAGLGGLKPRRGRPRIHPPQGEPKPVPTIIGAARKFPRETPARDGEPTPRGERPRSAVPWCPYGQRS